MIQVSLALDRLLDTVADMARDMHDEGTKAIQRASLLLVGGSIFIAFLNLFLTRQRGGPPIGLPVPPTSLISIPATTPPRFHWLVTSPARHCVRGSSLPGHPTCLSP